MRHRRPEQRTGKRRRLTAERLYMQLLAPEPGTENRQTLAAADALREMDARISAIGRRKGRRKAVQLELKRLAP